MFMRNNNSEQDKLGPLLHAISSDLELSVLVNLLIPLNIKIFLQILSFFPSQGQVLIQAPKAF